MKYQSLYTAALAIALAAGGQALAGPGGGGGGAGGMGGMSRQMGGDMGRNYEMPGEHRSDRALQQDRDREQYSGPEAERDTQKAKARAPGEGSDSGDQERDRLHEQE